MCDIFLWANNNFYVVLRSLKWLRLRKRVNMVSAANTIFRGAWARSTSHSSLTSLVSTRKSVFHLTWTIECNLWKYSFSECQERTNRTSRVERSFFKSYNVEKWNGLHHVPVCKAHHQNSKKQIKQTINFTKLFFQHTFMHQSGLRSHCNLRGIFQSSLPPCYIFWRFWNCGECLNQRCIGMFLAEAQCYSRPETFRFIS